MTRIHSRKPGTAAKLEDISRDSLQKAVLKETLQHPLALYPSVLGILGISATLVLGLPFPVLIASVCTFGGGLTSWIVNYFFRFDSLAERRLREHREALEAERLGLLERLETDLTAFQSVPGAEQFAWQGKEQLEGIQNKFDSLSTILGDKLDVSELTYARYLGVAEQVMLSVLGNLKNVATILKSVQSTDIDYIAERLEELKRLKDPTTADREEVETLLRRKALRDQQLQDVNILLTRNEQALTLLDTASAGIAGRDTSGEDSSLDMESAIEELQTLAKPTGEN